MIQNLLIVKKEEGIPGFVYSAIDIYNTDIDEDPEIVVTESNQ